MISLLLVFLFQSASAGLWNDQDGCPEGSAMSQLDCRCFRATENVRFKDAPTACDADEDFFDGRNASVLQAALQPLGWRGADVWTTGCGVPPSITFDDGEEVVRANGKRFGRVWRRSRQCLSYNVYRRDFVEGSCQRETRALCHRGFSTKCPFPIETEEPAPTGSASEMDAFCSSPGFLTCPGRDNACRISAVATASLDEDEEDCQNECRGEAECAFWFFNPAVGCQLFDRNAVLQVSSSAVALALRNVVGSRDCPLSAAPPPTQPPTGGADPGPVDCSFTGTPTCSGATCSILTSTPGLASADDCFAACLANAACDFYIFVSGPRTNCVFGQGIPSVEASTRDGVPTIGSRLCPFPGTITNA